MDIAQLIHKALSDEDTHRILGRRCKILKYSELERYQELEELLPNLLGYAVVLYEEQENSGHWVGILRYTGLYELFDPIRADPGQGAELGQPEGAERVDAVPLEPAQGREARLQPRQVPEPRQLREHTRQPRVTASTG